MVISIIVTNDSFIFGKSRAIITNKLKKVSYKRHKWRILSLKNILGFSNTTWTAIWILELVFLRD